MKRKLIRKILGGLSITSAMFIFQACYGSLQDFGFDVLIKGQVKSKTSGLPIQGIKVSVANNMQYEYTNEEGKFSFYTQRSENLGVKFEDIDALQNGSYFNYDTLLVNNLQETVTLNIELEER